MYIRAETEITHKLHNLTTLILYEIWKQNINIVHVVYTIFIGICLFRRKGRILWYFLCIRLMFVRLVTIRLLNFDTRSTIIKQLRLWLKRGSRFFGERGGGGENRPLYTTHVATRLDISLFSFYTQEDQIVGVLKNFVLTSVQTVRHHTISLQYPLFSY